VRIVLVKHALPVLDATTPPREWRLGDEGTRQAEALASALGRFIPFELVTSPEPKALATAEAVGRVHEVGWRVVADLREIDRTALPMMTPEAHQQFNARLFAEYDRAVVGAESARAAADRFRGALTRTAATATGNLVVITHGTVISLFVAEHNPVDPFDLWRRLTCPSFVVLDDGYRLVDRAVSTV
jgi:broad specificity phosphatase PhoE